MDGQEPVTENQRPEGQEPKVAAKTEPTEDMVPRSMVEKARTDAAKYRTKYQGVLKALREGQLPDSLLDAEDDEASRSLIEELKTLRAEKAQWEQERRTTATQSALRDALVDAGAESKKAALLLKGIDPASVKYDDKGQPTNIKALVDGLKTEYPDLFRPRGSVDPTEGGLGTSGGVNMNDLIRQAFYGR
ncbi:MAG: phage scaffolding protein [Anaerolineae bacterium]